MTHFRALSLLCAAALAGPVTLQAQQFITTVAGNGQTAPGPDGRAAIASGLNSPSGIATDSAGRVYFSDSGNHLVRRVELDGTVTTIAGTGQPGFSGDGGPGVKAMLNTPVALFVDRSGNVFVSDALNYRIRKIALSGIVSTVAGNGQSTGAVGDGGPATAAVLHQITAITGDSKGNLYFGDTISTNVNGTLMYSEAGVRKIAVDGTISRYAGAPLSSSQPPQCIVNVSAASFCKMIPSGIAMDASDTLYIASPGTQQFWKIGSNGFVTGTLAGFFTLADPLETIALDAAGRIYVTRPLYNDVTVVALLNGVTAYSTYAGTGGSGFSGDDGDSTKARLSSPVSIALDPIGRLYIADTGNNRIRAVTRPPYTQASYVVNAGSFAAGPIAAGELLSIYGQNFTGIVNPVAAPPYPTTIGGVSVSIKDSAGMAMPASVQAAAPGQINILVPSGLAPGAGTLTVTDKFARSVSVPVQVGNFAPGLFTASANGKGVPAATAILVDEGGNQTVEPVFQCAQDGCVSVPLDLGTAKSQLIITLYGTGIQGVSQADLTGTAGAQPLQILYSGAQSAFPGLDQVNVLVPYSLKGAGEVDLVLQSGTQVSNPVKVNFQ